MGAVSPQVWAVVCIVVVAGMLFGFFGRRGQVRRAKSAAADARGWIYKGTNISLARRWPGEPFVDGVRQEAQDIYSGMAAGSPFTSFTYRVATDPAAGPKAPLAPYHVVVIPVPDAVPSGTLPASPADLHDGWQVRACDDSLVAWRAGEPDLDAIEPAVTAAVAWAGQPASQ